MGLAKYLDIDDLTSPPMVAAREAWRAWCRADVDLDVVGDLRDLPGWTRQAGVIQVDAVLSKLAARTAHDSAAVTTLVWLLLPGATRTANEFRAHHTDIDRLVAGQLWLEASRAHELDTGKVAATILGRTRRGVCAELGLGDAGRRRDRAWANVVGDERLGEWLVALERESDPQHELLELLRSAWLDKAIVAFDMLLLWDLAGAAHRLEAPAHRGRMGLTAPAVVEEVARDLELASRTLRRRASTALDRLREYAAARDDTALLVAWKRNHPVMPLTAREELEIAIREEQWWDLVAGPAHLSPYEAADRLPRRPQRKMRA